MKLRSLRLAGLVLALSAVSAVQAQADLTSQKQKAGYSVGVSIGSNLAQQGVKDEIDVAALMQGMRDSLDGAKLKLADADMQKAVEVLSTSLQTKAQAKMELQSKANKEFLDKNAKVPGVKTTATGLQYSVISESKDPKAVKPKESDTVTVNYHGTLVDGTVFDSTTQGKKEPATFPLNGVIPGWTEGLQLMKVGDKFKFFVPAALGYGDQGVGPIPPGATLIFEVELLAIEKPQANGAKK